MNSLLKEGQFIAVSDELYLIDMEFLQRLRRSRPAKPRLSQGQIHDAVVEPASNALSNPSTILDPLSSPSSTNSLLYQSFEWYSHTSSSSSSSGSYYAALTSALPYLVNLGITLIWLPPGCKSGNPKGNGYDIYDLWDLGEFDWKGQRGTKWGEIEDLKRFCSVAKDQGVGLIWDAVLSHRAAADFCEDVKAVEVSSQNRLQVLSKPRNIKAWTGFDFPARSNNYSTLKLRSEHFNGTDWDHDRREKKIFNFIDEREKKLTWAQDVDSEFGNYDYLMFTNLNYRSRQLKMDTLNWAVWVTRELGLSGFRLDAMKHLPRSFVLDFLIHLQNEFGKDFFFVGEYWKWGNSVYLANIIQKMEGRCRLYDVQLCYNFSDYSEGKRKDLRRILEGSLVERDPQHAVTIVSNHDTQPTQLLAVPFESWFLPHAYCIILLRACASLPCVFHGHLYGIQGPEPQPPLEDLDVLMLVRKNFAYGTQYNYWDDPNCIGWTRVGREARDEQEGCVVLLNTGGQKMRKRMFIGRHATVGALITWSSVLGHTKDIITSKDGWGDFEVKAHSAAVWIRSERIQDFQQQISSLRKPRSEL